MLWRNHAATGEQGRGELYLWGRDPQARRHFVREWEHDWVRCEWEYDLPHSEWTELHAGLRRRKPDDLGQRGGDGVTVNADGTGLQAQGYYLWGKQRFPADDSLLPTNLRYIG